MRHLLRRVGNGHGALAVDAAITVSSTTFDPAPLGIVITPDGGSADVASSNAVWPIDLATAIVGTPISAPAALTSGGTAILSRFGIAFH